MIDSLEVPYYSFWNVDSPVFTVIRDSRQYVVSKSLKKQIERLGGYFSVPGSILLITGPGLIGKSAFCRYALMSLVPLMRPIKLVPIKSGVCMKGWLESQITSKEDSSSVACIVDNAQFLPKEGYEEIEMILRSQTNEAQKPSFCLVGQPGLLEQVRQSDYLYGQVRCHLSLETFQDEDALEFVKVRLTLADLPENLFPDPVIKLLNERAAGVPGVLSQLCEAVLIESAINQKKFIDFETLGEMGIKAEQGFVEGTDNQEQSSDSISDKLNIS